jgi:hypothetical protein
MTVANENVTHLDAIPIESNFHAIFGQAVMHLPGCQSIKVLYNVSPNFKQAKAPQIFLCGASLLTKN